MKVYYNKFLTILGKIGGLFLKSVSFFLLWKPLRAFCIPIIAFLLWMLRYRKQTIIENLEKAGSNPQVLKAFYKHFAQVILECFFIFAPRQGMKRFVQKHVTFQGLEHLEYAKKQGRGTIFIVSHLGNWEIMSAAGSVLAGHDILMVTKRLKPKWLHELVEKGRKAYGVHATYEPHTVQDILRALNNNQSVGIVLDQYLGPPFSIRVPFFGIPVGTSPLIALLARKKNPVVLFVNNIRQPDGSFIVNVSEPLRFIWNDSLAMCIRQNTAYYLQHIEKAIYQTPEQWLWSHRRFKGVLDPISEKELTSFRSKE